MYQQYQALGVERRGNVLWVTIRPEHHYHEELATIFRLISRDPETRAVVLTGSGDRVFSTGGDPGTMEANSGQNAWWLEILPGAREIVLGMLECDKPVIARINGHAIGVGCSIALCCDITIMVENAKIGDPHVKLGLVAGDGGALLWPHLVGWMACKRYLLTGDLLTGKEAADAGLVTMSVPREKLDETVDQWAERLANGASRAIALTKRGINMAIRQQAQVYTDAHLGLETMSFMTEDHLEGVQAALQKRAPVFKGR